MDASPDTVAAPAGAPAGTPKVTAIAPTFGGMTAASGMLPPLTAGSNIVVAQRKIYQITGTSVGGFEVVMQPDGTWNYPYRSITVGGTAHIGIFDRLAAAGFNCVRMLICEDVCTPGVKPAAYVNPTLNPDWFTNPADTTTVLDGVAILDLVIAYCGRLGLRVILDMHALAPNGNAATATCGLWYSTPGRLAPSSPVTHTSADLRNETDWINAWVSIAQRYAGNPVVIGADMINEPWAASWGDGNLETDVCAAYTRCGNAILTVNPNWLLFCEGIYKVFNFGQANGGYVGCGWAAGLDGAAACPVSPVVPNRVVYSPHDYGPGVNNWNYFNVAGYPANMTTVWNQMFGYLVNTNTAPIHVGEIGDMLVAGANGGYETAAKYGEAVQWVNLAMKYYAGKTTTNGVRDVPTGVAGFSWSWFCWSTNGYGGTPASIGNTNLLMQDFDTLNTTIMAYLSPWLAPQMLADVPIAVTLTLSSPAAGPATMSWGTSSATAMAGVHYRAGAGSVAFAAGQTTATIPLSLIALTAGSPGSLYFWLKLWAPSGCTIPNGAVPVSIVYS